MAPGSDTPSESLARFREYLHLLARLQIGPKLHGKLDPSDMAQETLLKAHQKIDQFRGSREGELAAWLRQMLSNNILDAARKLDRRHAGLERSPDQAMKGSSALLGECLATDQSTPSQHVMKDDQLRMLADGLAALPDDQREVVELRHLHGWSVPEISKHTGRSAASVAGLLRRGLKELRETMEKTR